MLKRCFRLHQLIVFMLTKDFSKFEKKSFFNEKENVKEVVTVNFVSEYHEILEVVKIVRIGQGVKKI